MLRLRGVTKRFGKRTVLDGFDLDVAAGELVAVVGANGSGKSTLLKICAGVIRPDAGTVEVFGTVGWCPQAGGLADGLTADEQFVLFGAPGNPTRATARARGRREAAAIDWTPTDQVASELSGGTRQKLNLVVSTLGHPDLLLLDEPYQGFDRGTYLDFWTQVERWRSQGRAVVVITHVLHELHRVDRVVDLGRSERGVAV